MATICGGVGSVKEPDAEIKAICESLRPHIQAKSGRDFSTFVVKSYASQVVAGTNYFIKIHVGGDEHIHVKAFKDLPFRGGEVSLTDMLEGKTAHDPIGFF